MAAPAYLIWEPPAPATNDAYRLAAFYLAYLDAKLE